jgi:5-hydroxyisourate hydrolase-like protein (transthyretin family)
MSLPRKRWLALAGAAMVAAATVGIALPALADPTTGTVAGHLTDAGSPVGSASVYLWDSNFTPAANGVTDSNGAFSLIDVPPGDYTISFTLGGQFTQYAYQQTDPAAAAIITVTSGNETTVDESVIAHGSLTGHVTRSDGSPLANPYVQAQSVNGFVFLQVNGDPDGGYSMPYVPAGSYIVSFRDGFSSPEEFAHQKTRREDADPIEVTVGATTTLDEQMLPTGAISGHFTDSNGQPLSSVNVSVYSTDNNFYGNTITDQDGSYRIVLFPATYTVQYQLLSGLVQYAHGKVDFRDADQFAVAAGPDTVVDEQLLPTGVISGHLTDASGNPVQDASVNASRGPDTYYATTDGSGFYELMVFQGDYRVQFGAPSGVQWAHGKTSAQTADEITVVANATTTVDETLLPTGSVTVTARDAVTGQTVSNFCTSLDSVGDFPCTQDGTATFSAVQPGTYTLAVYTDSDAYIVAQVHNVVVTSGHETSVVVDVTPAATLTTRVVDSKTGAPVPGVCLDLVEPLSPTGLGIGGAFYCSDGTGAVQVPHINPSTYNVFAWAHDGVHGNQWVGRDGGTGAQAQARRVTLGAGQTVAMPTIRMDLKGSVSGVITDATTHAPIPFAHAGFATVNAGFGGSSAQVLADAHGHYTIPNLGPYEWTLYFEANGYASQFSGGTPNRFAADGVQVKAGKTKTYDVALSKGLILTGIVTDPAGQPGNARVTVVSANSGDETGVNDTDATGRYTIHVLGDQNIKLRIEGYNNGESFRFYYVSAAGFGTATVIRIPAHGTKTVDITLTQPTT